MSKHSKKARNESSVKKLLLLFLSVFILSSCEKQNSILREIVNEKDGAFQYEIKKVIEEDSRKEYIIKMVSQHWLTSAEVNQTKWWHWLTIIIPDEVVESEGLMVIGGGSYKNNMPESADPALAQVAITTQSVVASITNVPFQPVLFAQDTLGERVEDDLIAYGWRQFLEGGARNKDAHWLAHIPMTKAVVRGMDVVQNITALEGKPVNRFVTTGASKRGWTTWATAIADDRVMAIIPIVIDMLNVVPSFNHHWKCYGEWSHAIDSYVHEGIMDWMGSREFNRMMDIVEPYSFRTKLTLPKFLINATGDEFFITDSWQFYWNDLLGDKYLQYIPNTSHGLQNTEGNYNLKSLIAFYKAVISESEIPKFDWHISNDSIYVKIDSSFTGSYIVKQWEAVNETTRDFRVDTIGRTWSSKTLPESDRGTYAVKIAQPEAGYRAGLLELTFNPKDENPFMFTTGTLVSPNSFPLPTS